MAKSFQLIQRSLAHWAAAVNDRFRGKHEVYDRLLTGTQVDFQ